MAKRHRKLLIWETADRRLCPNSGLPAWVAMRWRPKVKVFYAKKPTQRCVTIGGLTELRGFHPVRHTPIGPETSALPKAPRHTAFTNSQPTIACPSRVIKNPFNMRVKGEVGDAKFPQKEWETFFNGAPNS